MCPYILVFAQCLEVFFSCTLTDDAEPGLHNTVTHFGIDCSSGMTLTDSPLNGVRGCNNRPSECERKSNNTH